MALENYPIPTDEEGGDAAPYCLVLIQFKQYPKVLRGIYFAVFEAKEIIKELKNGRISWEKAVKEHSACEHSWYRDGDLGWFHLNDGVTPNFTMHVCTYEVGDLLDEPHRKSYGMHIIHRTG